MLAWVPTSTSVSAGTKRKSGGIHNGFVSTDHSNDIGVSFRGKVQFSHGFPGRCCAIDDKKSVRCTCCEELRYSLQPAGCLGQSTKHAVILIADDFDLGVDDIARNSVLFEDTCEDLDGGLEFFWYDLVRSRFLELARGPNEQSREEEAHDAGQPQRSAHENDEYRCRENDQEIIEKGERVHNSRPKESSVLKIIRSVT